MSKLNPNTRPARKLQRTFDVFVQSPEEDTYRKLIEELEIYMSLNDGWQTDEQYFADKQDDYMDYQMPF
jgi:hypothetical protein